MQLSLSEAQRDVPESNNSNLRYIFPVHDSMLFDFFCSRLNELYSAVKQSRKFLTRTAKLVTTPILKETFLQQVIDIEEHILSIKDVMISVETKPVSKRNNTIEALITEAEEVCEITIAGTATRDIGLILAIQKMNACLISSYTGIIQLAKTLGYENIADRLLSNVEDEHRSVKTLSELIENDINYLISTNVYKEQDSKKSTFKITSKSTSAKNNLHYGQKKGIGKIYRTDY